jgi:hypothetical protein
MQNEAIVKAIRPGIIRAVETQFPETGREVESKQSSEGLNALAALAGLNKYTKRSQQIADRIVEVLRDPEGYFGLVTNRELELLARLRKAALEYEKAIVALTTGDEKRLHLAIHDDDKHLGDQILSILSEYRLPVAFAARRAGVIARCAQSLLKERGALKEAGTRRNWKIAALAGICREIWAEQEWESDPIKYGKKPTLNIFSPKYLTNDNEERIQRYSKHIDEYANTTEKMDRPGPFGRFLESILGIVSDSEDVPPSAQTALRSWRDARKQFDPK